VEKDSGSRYRNKEDNEQEHRKCETIEMPPHDGAALSRIDDMRALGFEIRYQSGCQVLGASYESFSSVLRFLTFLLWGTYVAPTEQACALFCGKSNRKFL
jgi:hypothetical protein